MQHPRVLKIKQKFKLNKKFSFRCVSEATVRKFVKSLSSDKATAGQSSVYIVKNGETYLLELTNWINEAIIKNKLPDSLKLSDATPAYKNLTLIIKPVIDYIKYFLQSTSEMAGIAWLGLLYWHNFHGFL